MYIDDYLILGDAQAITASAATTNVVDTLAAGHALNDMVWAKFQVDTLFAGTTGSTVQMIIQTSSDNSNWVDLCSATTTMASLTAGAVPFVTKLPLGVLRYIRGYYTVTGGFSSGKMDCRLVKDVDVTMDKNL